MDGAAKPSKAREAVTGTEKDDPAEAWLTIEAAPDPSAGSVAGSAPDLALVVRIVVRRIYSSALESAGVPFIAMATIAPRPNGESRRAEIRIEGFPISWSIESARAAGAEATVRADGSFRAILDAITGVRRARVELRCEGMTAAADALLVDAWRWPWLPDMPRLLPALVVPNDGVVRHVIAGARGASATLGGSAVRGESAALGVLAARSAARAPDAQRAPEAPVALFEHLRDGFAIDYCLPAIERLPHGGALQLIRAPHRVIVNIAGGRGEGDCLDLTLFLAGCLEALGHAPLIVLIHDVDDHPTHAVLGFWRDQAQRFRPLLASDDLRQRVRDGELRIVETTHVCRGHGASFAEAENEASRRVLEAPRVTAVDVLALRPPYGSVASLDLAFDPAVSAAVHESERVGRERDTPTVETLHLFYATLCIDGPIGARILSGAGIARDALVSECEVELARRSRAGKIGRTRGYERCLTDARENARSQGSTVVRESDLWWALLMSGGKSLAGVFGAQPTARARLLSALAKIAPSARPRSTI